MSEKIEFRDKELFELEDKISPLRNLAGWIKCQDCMMFGIPMPHDRKCGNCGAENCLMLYDEIAVLDLIEKERQDAI